MNKSKSHHGVLVLFFASFLFSLITVFNRFVPSDIGTFYQLFLRAVLMSIMFLILGISFKDLSSIKRKDLPLFVFRGLLFAGDFASIFIAANHLPLGTALFLFYSGSIVVSYLYGSIILHEKIDKTKIVSLFSAFVGLVIIYSGSFSALANSYILFAILSGICFGLSTASSKNLSDKYSVNQINLVAYFVAAVVSVPLLFINKESISLALPISTWIIFIVFALLGVLTFYATIYGYKYVEAQKASLILLGELIFIFIIGFILYQEAPTGTTIIGGLFVVLALILPNIQSFSHSKK